MCLHDVDRKTATTVDVNAVDGRRPLDTPMMNE